MDKVIVYSSNTCPHCTTAKQYLTEKGIAYEEKNVGTDMEARKELMAKGYMGVPVLIIGDEEIVGFDKEKIDKAIEGK
ncbi:MAG: glutaredoxin family protein [Tissierellales bacterium]|jgi:glutaredoxin-like YruB-family protein|nr:glutaredoxin family protein [Tissierellales bacterium]